MALIQCPECNREISDAVERCPFCGYPIKTNIGKWNQIKVSSIAKKQSILFSVMICFLIVCVVGLKYMTGNVAKAKKYYKDNDYSSFVVLEEKMNKKDKERFADYLEGEVSQIVVEFESEKITGDKAINKMKNLIKYSNKIMVTNYSENLSFIMDLKESREAFEMAEEAEMNNEYIVAYNNFAKVIERDKQYSEAQERMAGLEKPLIDSYKKEAETKASTGDYEGAISCVYSALEIDNDNVELKSLVKQYEIEKEEAKKVEEATKRAKALLSIGKVIKGPEIQATFKGASIAKNIYPDNRSGYYMYYYPQDDTKIYLDIVLRIKNISNYPKTLDSVVSSVKATYNSSYIYNSYSCFYSDSSNIDPVYSWDTIDALSSYTFHLAIVMPEEIAKTDYPIKVEFTLDGEKQILEFR